MIRTEQLTKQFGDFTAVDNVNLEIAQGEFFAFLGPNGAGKTTTIKLLTGLIRPTKGRAIIGNFDIQTEPVKARQLLSFVPDFPFLYDKLEPMEFMVLVGQLYGMERRAALEGSEELFQLLGLNEVRHKLIETLSHGTRQRLAIASGLLHNPKVFIIDEPMVGLDPRSARVVKNVLKQRSRAGMTVFLSTHILHIAEELADRIGILHRGRLVAAGTMEELRQTIGSSGALEDAFLAITNEEHHLKGQEKAPVT
jgi:ABC-2 type transport system ATP-binding protein